MLDIIERHATTLRIIEALAAVGIVVILVTMHGHSGTVTRPVAALVGLPWAVFVAASLPLTYLSWFRDAKPGVLTVARRVFYCSLVLAFVVTLVGFYAAVIT